MRRVTIAVVCFTLLFALSGCSGIPHQSVQQSVTVTVSAPSQTVSVFGTLQFTATVTGSTNMGVTWQVGGVTGGSHATGFISSAGLFVAPSAATSKSDGTPIPTTITAVSQANSADSGSMMVTVVASPNQKTQGGAVILGTSGGNKTDSAGNKCCSGTLGALVVRNNKKYILSNNHILAKSDLGIPGGPPTGDAITQPGLAETQCQQSGLNTVANLSEFYNLESGSLPKIDAAIAQIIDGSVDPNGNILLLGSTMTNGVPDPGMPASGAAGTGTTATLAMNVAKSGRTSGLTCSSVIGINTTSTVDYFKNCGDTVKAFTVTYSDLVEVQGGTFSSSGDSGSLIVQQETAEPVALLFAGNDTDTVGNAISDVMAFFTANGGSATTFQNAANHQVIGCTLPTKPASLVETQGAMLAADTIEKAVAARDAHVTELMGHPEVQVIGVGASYDNPGEAAVLLFVAKDQARTNLPAQLEGVRTRIIEGQAFARRGALTIDESAQLERGFAPPQQVYAIPETEVARARTVETARVDEWMKKTGVQGVGITSSVDSPGEAALMIYLIRGMEHPAIPAVIDGLRTRVREGSRFHAGLGGPRPGGGCSVPAAKNADARARSSTQSKRADR
jgi:hypothetical protein